MIGLRHFVQRIGAGLALLAMLALILHGTAHASRVGAQSPAGHELSTTSHAHPAAELHHHHAGHGHDQQSESPSAPDQGCCCGGSSGCAAVLLPVPAVLMPQVPLRAGPILTGNRETGITPQGLRRPPRLQAIA